jgi:hypothetical protein
VTESEAPLPGWDIPKESSIPKDSSTEPLLGAETGETDSASWTRLFVNVGRREQLQRGDLESMLTSAGVAESDIGRVNKRDRLTYVSVKPSAVDAAIAALSGKVVGGRKVVAEVARPSLQEK